MEATLPSASAPTLPPAVAPAAVSSPTPAALPPFPRPLTPPSPFAFVRALAGYAALGGVAALGWAGGQPSLAPLGVVSAVGALALTVPALLVAHPFLGLRATPESLLTAIARPFARCGDLALALALPLLLFRATSGLAPLLLDLLLVGVGGLGLSLATGHLVAAEAGTGAPILRLAKMTFLAWAWALLAALIGLRLGLA